MGVGMGGSVELGVEHDKGVGTLKLVLVRKNETRRTFRASHALIISCSSTHGNS